MDETINRLLIVVVSCSTIGLLLGGTISRTEMNNCLEGKTQTSACLTQDPVFKTLEGMGIGLLAGAGAALGATWSTGEKDK